MSLYSSDKTLRITWMGESTTIKLQVDSTQERLGELLKDIVFQNLRHVVETTLAGRGMSDVMKANAPDSCLTEIDFDEIFEGKTHDQP